MKMQPDQSPGLNIINAYDEHHFAINGQRFEHALLLPANGAALLWEPAFFADLALTHFEAIAELDAELVILGTGMHHFFPRPEWLVPLINKRIGLEAMSTPAALRTYNILAAEGRKVAAALLLNR